MRHYYQSIGGYFDYEDLYSRMVKEAKPGAMFAELGVFKGKSAAYMGVEIINSGKDIRLVCVDSWAEHWTSMLSTDENTFKECLNNIAPVQDVIEIVRGKTEEVCYSIGRKFDFVFVDADHSEEGVKNNIEGWLPLIKPGGYIGGHDYTKHWPGTMKVVRETFKNYQVINSCWLVHV